MILSWSIRFSKALGKEPLLRTGSFAALTAPSVARKGREEKPERQEKPEKKPGKRTPEEGKEGAEKEAKRARISGIAPSPAGGLYSWGIRWTGMPKGKRRKSDVVFGQ